jgi:hypothetical protein
MGSALGSGFAQYSWAKAAARGEAQISFSSAAGEASLAAHPAAKPERKYF